MITTAPDESALPSEKIVRRIANCEGVDPLDLPPLYEAIDTDALNTLVGADTQRAAAPDVEFTYHGYEVTITNGEVIHVDEADSPATNT